MGKGYFILLWDAWGDGCVRINPRLYTEGTDASGNLKNWWFCSDEEEQYKIVARHQLQRFPFYLIVWD